MFCKTIILSNSENLSSNAPKGILTLSKENNKTLGKIRLYNISALPQGTKIGLYINEKVHISPITKKPNHYEFELDNNTDITQSIYCALIDTNNNKKVLLEGGSFNGFYFTDSPFDAVLEAKDEELEQTIDTALKDVENCENCNCVDCEYKKYFYDNYSQTNTSIVNNENIDNTIVEKNLKQSTKIPQAQNEFIKDINNKVEQIETVEDDIKNIVVKDSVPIESVLSNNSQDVVDNIQQGVINQLNDEISAEFNNLTRQFEDIENIVSSNSVDNDIKDNLEINRQDNSENVSQDLLADNINPINTQEESNKVEDKDKLEFLNEIIEQLDVMFEQNPPEDVLNSIIPHSRFVQVQNESPYVLGVIYEEQMLKYIAYGVPAQYNDLPPSDLGQHYQWLPLNPRDVMSDGYFMIYQDALSGNLVEINFEE